LTEARLRCYCFGDGLERELRSPAAREPARETASAEPTLPASLRWMPALFVLLHPVLAVRVVHPPLVGVTQNVVRHRDFSELLLGTALVRVVLQRHLPVRLLQSPIVRAAVDAEDLVKIPTRARADHDCGQHQRS